MTTTTTRAIERKSVDFNIKLTPSMHAELVASAAANERTVAAEIRYRVARDLGRFPATPGDRERA